MVLVNARKEHRTTIVQEGRNPFVESKSSEEHRSYDRVVDLCLKAALHAEQTSLSMFKRPGGTPGLGSSRSLQRRFRHHVPFPAHDKMVGFLTAGSFHVPTLLRVRMLESKPAQQKHDNELYALHRHTLFVNSSKFERELQRMMVTSLSPSAMETLDIQDDLTETEHEGRKAGSVTHTTWQVTQAVMAACLRTSVNFLGPKPGFRS